MPRPAQTTSVHPTAIVARDAELGEGVTVGPYAVVDAGAVIGPGTTIGAHAVVTGFATLGADCQIHFGAIVGHDPQDLSFDGSATRVEIGARTIIREYATVHRSTREGRPTVLGSDCYLMGHAHVAHDCRIGDRVIICNSALVAGHCEIGDRAFLSGNTVVHQFCRVGALVMLSGTSGIGRDIGPYLTVAGRSDVVGVNSVGLRRAGVDGPARQRVKHAYRLLFGAPSLDVGLDRVRELGTQHPEIAAITGFYAGSRRGYSRPPAGHAFGDVEAEAG